MSKINVLPKHLSELIAAGEVVERPASVVKELLENSIDAGADNINIEIKNGGISYIRITDNGCGIMRDDIRNAFVSHATSKISTADDLNSIFTLGFRGEALASVGAVARVEVLTKSEEEDIGTHYVFESGEEILLDDAGCPKGTTIIVRDLFYKTPARMKFLKKDVTEANAVAAVVDRIALSHPEISIRFIREGKQVLITSGNGDLINCIREVLGKSFSDDLIYAEGSSGAVSVSGYISKPSASRPNRNMQFFFINDRLVKTATGSAALSEAYKNSIMVGKFPSCVLNIKIDPTLVDVNVHPAKTQVRFSDEKPVFNAIYYACKNALASGDTPKSIHRTNVDPYKSDKRESEQLFIRPVSSEKSSDFWQHIDLNKKDNNDSKTQNGDSKSDKSPNAQKSAVASSQSGFANVTFFEPKHESSSESVNSGSLQKNDSFISSFASPDTDESKIFFGGISTVENPSEETVAEPVIKITHFGEVATENSSHENNSRASEHETGEKASNEPIADTVVISHIEQSEEDEVVIVGEAFKTYIICEKGNKLLIIDKHAAHERIIYEKLRAECGDRTAQLLLMPVTVTLSKEEYSGIIENIDLINNSGFDIEDFGDGCVVVRECPMELDSDDIESVVAEIAGKFSENTRSVSVEKLDWIYHSVACRAAIKAGNFTSRYEMERFAKQLLKMPDIRYCPHGRPVLIEMTKRELERNFGRV